MDAQICPVVKDTPELFVYRASTLRRSNLSSLTAQVVWVWTSVHTALRDVGMAVQTRSTGRGRQRRSATAEKTMIVFAQQSRYWYLQQTSGRSHTESCSLSHFQPIKQQEGGGMFLRDQWLP